MDEGIVIGHARRDSCRNPDKPPIVRASLNRVGAVCAYIPAEDSIRSLVKGRASIPLDKVVFIPELHVLPTYKRLEALKEMILDNSGEGKRIAEQEEGEEHHVLQDDDDYWGDEKLVDVEST
ncbi:hypothetical protein EK21DRAFT_117569 [Setomelanomma holmii]|uniref:Uncharacterized protein n=1 Tax=Setomelanomma holmii TaxID=210430 RepID=A0A9P4LI10_9PLEO|nr:hypothetical protein EK21DRAFT_117569 [Setomelanomma holmii]